MEEEVKYEVMNKLIEYCNGYYNGEWFDSLFDAKTIQNILYIFNVFHLFFLHSQKQITSSPTPPPPSSPVYAIRNSIMSLFFSFSFHMKYFWKHLSVDPSSLLLSSSSSSSDFILESNPKGYGIEEVKNTPIGIISRKYWESNIGKYLKTQKEEENREFISSLISKAEEDIQKGRVYFFTSEKSTAEIKEILKVVGEHTAIPANIVKEEIFAKFIRSESYWRKQRENIDKHDKLNYLQQPINFYAISQPNAHGRYENSEEKRS